MRDARMTSREAVQVVRDARGETDVVISSMGNAREWMALGPLHPLDFVLVPSAMGHATSMALGLALAQPQRRIIVLSGDGSLLMNLGNLVTIASQAPRNLAVVVFVNGVYEVTGGQPLPGTGASLDFVRIAEGSGIASVHRVTQAEHWKRSAPTLLAMNGPTVVFVDVQPDAGARGPRSPGPAGERAQRFMRALTGDV